MAERKTRATREESLNAKIAANLEQQKKLIEKLEALKAAERELQKTLADMKDEKKKAEKAAEAKARKAAKARLDKELLKAIHKSGLSAEEIMKKLGV